MKPTKAFITYENQPAFVPHSTETTFEEAAKKIGLLGSFSTDVGEYTSQDFKCRGVAWNGHQFEVVSLFAQFDLGQLELRLSGGTHEVQMQLHYPVDPRLTDRDCEGATIAYHNGTDDGWLFAHCDQDYMRDREMELQSAIMTVFQPHMDKLTMEVLSTPENRPTNAPIGVPWEGPLAKRVKLDNLTKIRGWVIDCALKHVREYHIGAYHQAPHASHIYERVKSCIDKAAFIHRFTQSATYQSVSAQMSQIMASVSNPHTYETRWDKAARVKAEAAKREQNQ